MMGVSESIAVRFLEAEGAVVVNRLEAMTNAGSD